MATIAQNLQKIKTSTSNIKQSIINKGGEISGDISTWATAIDNLPSGGGGEELIFEGTYYKDFMGVGINGQMTTPAPFAGRLYIIYFNGSTISLHMTSDFMEGDTIYEDYVFGGEPGFLYPTYILGAFYAPNIRYITSNESQFNFTDMALKVKCVLTEV